MNEDSINKMIDELTEMLHQLNKKKRLGSEFYSAAGLCEKLLRELLFLKQTGAFNK